MKPLLMLVECQNVCQNDGVCTPLDHDARCVCKRGFSGEFCEINIDECEQSPCLNGATCQDMNIGYQCRCLEGENTKVSLYTVMLPTIYRKSVIRYTEHLFSDTRCCV